MIIDTRGRLLRDLRISLTDACNFRCSYCMPSSTYADDHAFLRHEELLSFDELLALSGVAMELGVRKIKLTGGEPLLRPWVPSLIERINELAFNMKIDLDLALITNGSHLAPLVPRLMAAGLKRITISLDSLDPETFGRINGRGHALGPVLEGIERAYSAGLRPLKINTVLMRGVNDSEIERLAVHFRRPGVELRFIEYMDVGGALHWRRDQVVPSAEILERLRALGTLYERPPRAGSEVARSFAWADGCGELGFISSVTEPFCGSCTRLRVTAEGKLHTCLFGPARADLRPLLRAQPALSDEALAQALREQLTSVWRTRGDRYSELRAATRYEASVGLHPADASTNLGEGSAAASVHPLPQAIALREAMNRLGG